jgi:hypothetical protein
MGARATTGLIALLVTLGTIGVTLGAVAGPAQAAGGGSTIRMVKVNAAQAPSQATKDQAKAKFKGTPTSPAKTGVAASPNIIDTRPPPPDPGPAPTTTIVPDSYYNGLSTDPYPTYEEVRDNNGQACVDLQIGLYLEGDPLNHLGFCEETYAEAQIIGPNGLRQAWVGFNTYTLHQTMLPGLPSRRATASLVVVPTPVQGFDPFGELDRWVVTIGYRCILSTAARSCDYRTQSGVTKTIGEWRATAGPTVFAYDFGDGDGWVNPTVGDNLSQYVTLLSINGDMPAGVVHQCDYGLPFRNQPPEFGVIQTGCVFPGVQSPLRRIRGDDPAVAAAGTHIYDAITNPNATYPPSKGGKPKVIPSLLRRTTIASKIDANRSAAKCSRNDPLLNNPLYQCDEYPFASTYEGAKSGGDYSVREIPYKDNERAGQYLLAFYAGWRILDGDYLQVYPTPPVSPPARVAIPAN